MESLLHNEMHIIMSFVQGDSGKKWAAGLSGWNRTSHVPLCAWDKITCNDDSKVVEIDLSEQNLQGTLSPKLGHLHSLTTLVIRNNNFIGTIPPSIGTLPSLKIAILASNSLTGKLPTFTSPSLIALDISHNSLSGTIATLPPSSRLERFDASHNTFSGTIPYISADTYQNLDFLDLGVNELTGTIPPTLGALLHLRGLFLNDNNLVGPIPQQIARSNLKYVQLFLEDNYLSGTIPLGLADMINLKDLFLDENKLTGTIPVDLCHENLNSDFYEGDFDGPDRDGCTSIACPADHTSKEGVYPCRECPEGTQTPYLGHAGDCYPTPDKASQRTILETFYHATSGPEWNDGRGGEGWTTSSESSTSLCRWEGVACDDEGYVTALSLPRRGLRGPIVPELGYLPRLERLILNDNELTGFLPSDLRFTALEVLDVSGNRMTGAVPPLLCHNRDVNANGDNAKDGLSLCERVVCPVGTWNVMGRANETMRCGVCKTATYLGSKECHGLMMAGYNVEEELNRVALVVAVITGVLGVIGMLGLGYQRCRGRGEGRGGVVNEILGSFNSGNASDYDFDEEGSHDEPVIEVRDDDRPPRNNRLESNYDNSSFVM